MQKRVVPAALNKVADKARTEMTRAITGEFNIPASEVRARLSVIRAKRDVMKWRAVLHPFASARRGRSLNMIRFVERSVSMAEIRRRKATGAQNQLYFKIKRNGARKTIQGAFIANKGRTVFVREGDKRLPIKALSTIDVPQMFNTRRIQWRVINKINADMQVEFDRAINAALRGVFR